MSSAQCFRTGNLLECFDRGSGDPQRHDAEAGDDAGKRGYAIARLRKDIWVGEARPKAVRHKHIAYDYIVAASTSQPAYVPGIDDLAPSQFLENLQTFHGREVEPAISRGRKDAKKSRVS